MMKKPGILLFTMLMMSMITTSCIEEYEPDYSDFESELVINALFNHDTPWDVEISSSAHILEDLPGNEKITDAKVEIYDQNNEFLYELFHIVDGRYGHEDYSPSPKRGYSIKVSAPGYRAVTAKSFVPEKSTLLINNVLIIPNEKDNDVEVDFEIEDRSELESYYIWEIVSIDEDTYGGIESSTNPLSDKWIDDLKDPDKIINTGREILEGGLFGNGTYQGTYNSTDGNRRLAVGTQNTGLLEHHAYEINSNHKLDPNTNNPVDINNNEIGEDDYDEEEDPNKVEFKYELRVMTISKELYNYYTSLEAYYQEGDNNNSENIPLDIYTNVSNGRGIFAGYSESVIQF